MATDTLAGCHALVLAAGASTTVCDRKGRTPAEDTADESIRDAILAERAPRRLLQLMGEEGRRKGQQRHEESCARPS